MKWIELKEKIYYADGMLRDIYIKETSIADNKKWIEYVNANFDIEFFNKNNNKIENKINFNTVNKWWKREIENVVSAKFLCGANIQINNHFFCHSDIENDIDPREITSIADHNDIVHYMQEISQLLNKIVILTPENSPHIILMKIDKDVVTYK